MRDKVTDMRTAIAASVNDGDVVALEGFSHLIPFAAGHEIIRQSRRGLTLVRLTPDLIYDQMIAAGVADRMLFGWMGLAGVGQLHAIRRRVESADPAPLAVEEYSHHALLGRYIAAAARLPFYPLRSYLGSDLADTNPNVMPIASPFGDDDSVYAVSPLALDVGIVHAQRADRHGNTQLWGLVGVQREVAYAARRTIVVVEELVDEDVVRADPSRTLIPGIVVDAVVVCPGGAHPSFAQGYYDRDRDFYLTWNEISKDPARIAAWLDEWVVETADHAEYLEKLGGLDRLVPTPRLSGAVNYGGYS